MRLSAVAGLWTALVIVLGGASSAAAQPLGVFSWQLQPYCNLLTFTVTQHGDVFTLDGYDNNCGAATRSPALGIATINPNGSVQMAITVVTSPHGTSRYIDATLSLVTVSGTWRSGSELDGSLAFNAATGGSTMPLAGRDLDVTNYGAAAFIHAQRAQGTPALPAAVLEGHGLGSLGAAGYDGQYFATGGSILVSATQNWTPAAHGSRMLFSTAENDQSCVATRMTILGNGFVGINTTAPLQRLHVNGAARIGSCTYDTDGDVSCVSDVRFKRDVRDLPSMLDRVTALRPVQFAWRTEQFPDRDLPAHESIGLLAQDVEAVLPELVTTDADGYKAVNYGRLPLLAIQAIRELKEKDDALERRLATLEAALRALSSDRRHH
jgi:hypothetical protein